MLHSFSNTEEASTSRQAKKRRIAIDEQPITSTSFADSEENKISIIEPELIKLEVDNPAYCEASDETNLVESKIITVEVNEFAEFKKEMREMFSQITNDIKSLKRSFTYEIKKLEEKMEFYFNNETNNATSLSDLKYFLNLNEPLKDLTSFQEFELKLNTQKEFLEALREVLAYKVRTKSLTEAINNFLSLLMDPQLQVRFSACGKINRGVVKENFSSTTTYNEFKDYLLIQFPAETEANILSKTSRWFANSKDRFVGRKSKNS